MNLNKEELQILSNVLVDKDGFKLMLILLRQFGAFERGLNRNSTDKETFLTLGKREQGQWLLDNIYQANREKYQELLKENYK